MTTERKDPRDVDWFCALRIHSNVFILFLFPSCFCTSTCDETAVDTHSGSSRQRQGPVVNGSQIELH